jgi:hypothetical protein
MSGFFIRDLLNLTSSSTDNNNQQGGQAEENGTSSFNDNSQSSGRETPRRLVGLFFLNLLRHLCIFYLSKPLTFFQLSYLTSHYSSLSLHKFT